MDPVADEPDAQPGIEIERLAARVAPGPHESSTEFGDGYADMVATLQEMGVDLPVIPERLRTQTIRFRAGVWATQPFTADLLHRLVPDDDLSLDGFALGHVGHGWNSWYIAYSRWSAGSLAQGREHWGGIGWSRNDPAAVARMFTAVEENLADAVLRGELYTRREQVNTRGRKATPEEIEQQRRRNAARRGVQYPADEMPDGSDPD